MAAIYVTEGRVALLDNLRIADSPNWRLGLFKNDYVPTALTTIFDLTAATYSGYSPQTPVWSAAVLFSSVGRMTAPALAYVHNGGAVANTVYGYYLYHPGNNKLLFVERFSVSKSMAANGDVITISLAMTENPV